MKVREHSDEACLIKKKKRGASICRSHRKCQVPFGYKPLGVWQQPSNITALWQCSHPIFNMKKWRKLLWDAYKIFFWLHNQFCCLNLICFFGEYCWRWCRVSILFPFWPSLPSIGHNPMPRWRVLRVDHYYKRPFYVYVSCLTPWWSLEMIETLEMLSVCKLGRAWP